MMADSQVIERLPLEHPLPEEIQAMPQDDTVCKFCGVSYLIHREVKRLEDKVSPRGKNNNFLFCAFSEEKK